VVGPRDDKLGKAAADRVAVVLSPSGGEEQQRPVSLRSGRKGQGKLHLDLCAGRLVTLAALFARQARVGHPLEADRIAHLELSVGVLADRYRPPVCRSVR
jgi:NADPH-dependent ferric siderophore reductase